MTVETRGIKQLFSVEDALRNLANDASGGLPIMQERERIMAPLITALMAWSNAQAAMGNNASIRRLSPDDLVNLYVSVAGSITATLVVSTVHPVYRPNAMRAITARLGDMLSIVAADMARTGPHIHKEGAA